MASLQTRPAAYVCGAGVLLSLGAWAAAPVMAQSGTCVLSPDRRNPSRTAMIRFADVCTGGLALVRSMFVQASPLPLQDEGAALAHCPGDRVAWANTATHTLHSRGDHHFWQTLARGECDDLGNMIGERRSSVDDHCLSICSREAIERLD